MYAKLAFRNMKRSARDYLVYFVTVMLAVAVMFAFNSLIFSKDVLELTVAMENFKKGILAVSVVMMLIMALLVSYTGSFILKKRKREFATYLLLGMERGKVCRICLIENLLVGALSFFVGIAFGALLYQVFAAIIMNIFKSTYRVSLAFTWQAVLLTLAYTAVVYLFLLLRSLRYLRKTKIHDMLYSAKRNERVFLRRPAVRVALLAVAVVLTGGGLLGIHLVIKAAFEGDGAYAGLAFLAVMGLIAAVLFGMVLFYYGLSALLSSLMNRNKRFKYRNTNLFLTKQVTSKLNTNGVLMGGVSVMLMLTFVGLSFAMTLRNEEEKSAQRRAPYDIHLFATEEDTEFSKALPIIGEKAEIRKTAEYRLYGTGLKTVFAYLEGQNIVTRHEDYAIRLSEYNALRALLGYPAAKLSAGQYLLHIDSDVVYRNALRNIPAGLAWEYGDSRLRLAGINQEPFGLSFPYVGYLVVVPEETPLAGEITLDGMAVMTVGEAPEELYELLNVSKTIEIEDEGEGYVVVTENLYGWRALVQSQVFNSTRSTMSIVVFGFFYMGIVFILMSAAILAVQQLSDSTEHRERFDILRKLGVSEMDLAKLVFRQLAIYFFCPVMLPLLVGLGGVAILASVFAIAVVPMWFYLNFVIAVGIFAVLYLCYFAATYFGFLQNVSKKSA